MEREILLLGDPGLYEVSEKVRREELPEIEGVVRDLHDTMMSYRRRMKAGRAIAAPQIGVKKRLLYMCIDQPVVFINPQLEFPDGEMMEVLDDCMSFPYLYVKVMRYRHCVITYKDQDWQDCRMELEGDLSELLQHEYDHLDGVLAVMRAVDERSLVMKRPDREQKL